MRRVKTFLVNLSALTSENLGPRFYEPSFLFVKERLSRCERLSSYLTMPPAGGSTPPYYMFRPDSDFGAPFLRTSAISRDFINMNDVTYVHRGYCGTRLKRSIGVPFDVLFTMTGRFMGKAVVIPESLKEVHISQNSVVLRTSDKYQAAYLALFLNSTVNQVQIRGLYTITKQKYLSQGSIGSLRIVPYSTALNPILDQYLVGISLYYRAAESLRAAIGAVDAHVLPPRDLEAGPQTFRQNPSDFSHKIMTPRFYCQRYRHFLDSALAKCKGRKTLRSFAEPRRGDEIGSSNYLDEGVPFIKTSDCLNFNVDYQPDHYCSNGVYSGLGQDVRTHDLLLAKDGKIGEMALVSGDRHFAFCAGLVRLRSGDPMTQMLLFSILGSAIGRVQFRMWTVIASTMAHLRGEFFDQCVIPELPDEATRKVYDHCTEGLLLRQQSAELIADAKDKVEHHLFSYGD